MWGSRGEKARREQAKREAELDRNCPGQQAATHRSSRPNRG